MYRNKVNVILAASAAAGALLLGGAGGAAAAPVRQTSATSHGSTSAPGVANAVLSDANITFRTLDDDKDNDTFLRVRVFDSAHRLVAVTSGFFGPFPDQTTNGPFSFRIRSGIDLSALDGGTMEVSIVPNGNDTWKFAFDAEFNDADGGFLPVSSPDVVVLTQSHRTETFPLS
jgi:hypothetical protein